MLVRDRDGYVYPYSEQAASVLDCLRQCLLKYGVELVCGCEIASVKKNGDEFVISGNIRDIEAENRRAEAKKNSGKKDGKKPEVTGTIRRRMLPVARSAMWRSLSGYPARREGLLWPPALLPEVYAIKAPARQENRLGTRRATINQTQCLDTILHAASDTTL